MFYFLFIIKLKTRSAVIFFFFFLNDPPTTEIYTLPLHHALPIGIGTAGVGTATAGTARLGSAPNIGGVNIAFGMTGLNGARCLGVSNGRLSESYAAFTAKSREIGRAHV